MAGEGEFLRWQVARRALCPIFYGSVTDRLFRLSLVIERHPPDFLDLFVLSEAADADMAAAQIVVPVPVHAAQGTFVVDLPAVSENGKRIGNARRAGVHDGARRTANRALPVADFGTVQPTCGLRRERQGDRGVVSLVYEG